jgi:hypothetical protein
MWRPGGLANAPWSEREVTSKDDDDDDDDDDDNGVPRAAVFDAEKYAEAGISDAASADEVDEPDEAWAKRGVGKCGRRSGLVCTPRAAAISPTTAADEGTAARAFEIGLSRISASAAAGLGPPPNS